MNPNVDENSFEPQKNVDNGIPPFETTREKLPKTKRRWWIYLLIGLGSLILLGIIAVVAIYSYYMSLVKNYTETKPRNFEPILTSRENVQTLYMRWTNYVADVLDKHLSEQFVLTEEEVNQTIVTFGRAKDYIRVAFTNGYVKAMLSIPLDNTGKKELKGRYINADAYLKLQIEDGFLTLRLDSAIANGKPVPKWIVKRIHQKNFLENLEQNYDFLLLLQEMENVQVKDRTVVFTPLKNNK